MDYKAKYNKALKKARKTILGYDLYKESKPQWKPTKEQLIALDHLITRHPCEIEVIIELQKQLKSLYEL